MTTILPRLKGGDLNTKIEIMRATVVVTRGEPIVTGWAPIAAPYAEVIGQSGRVALIAKVLEGISVYRFRIRWRDGVLPDDQIRLNGAGGIDLNIEAPPYDPNGDREQLVIFASTNGAQRTT